MKKLLFFFVPFSLFTTHFLLAQNLETTITVGVYSLSNGDYVDTGRILTFDSQQECQVWARSAMADEHSDDTHDHWNAAGDVYFDEINRTFTWTEYGPELDSETVEQLCLNKEDGVTKTIDETNYYKDKANLYLRITSIDSYDDQNGDSSTNDPIGSETETDEGTLSEGDQTNQRESNADDHNDGENAPIVAPESLDGWVLRLEIDAADGEDVDIISFSAGQATESDEEGGAP